MAKTKASTEETVSVLALVPGMQKYVVEIASSEMPGAVDPVFISNGDYKCTIKRGIPVVVPEAVVTVLRDAKTGVMDQETRIMREVPSYPFSAVPYHGDEKIGSRMTGGM